MERYERRCNTRNLKLNGLHATIIHLPSEKLSAPIQHKSLKFQYIYQKSVHNVTLRAALILSISIPPSHYVQHLSVRLPSSLPTIVIATSSSKTAFSRANARNAIKMAVGITSRNPTIVQSLQDIEDLGLQVCY